MTMIETPGELIETPPTGEAADHRDALLADVLSHIRLSGALFLRGHYSAPWSLYSPGNCDLIDLLSPEAERLLVFHTVRKGRVVVTARGQSVVLEAGEMAVLPHADSHVMAGGDEIGATPIAELLPEAPWSDIPFIRFGGGGDEAEIVCGYFRCDELLFNAVLRRLPPIFAVRPAGRAAALFDAAVNYALEDGSRSGGVTAMDHVTELLLREALRLYAEDTPGNGGWLAAANDPVVSRALKLLHDDPIHDWTADELARRANTSRSVLGARFKALRGSRRSATLSSGGCSSRPISCAAAT